MIRGNSKFIYFWDLWIAFLATYAAIEIPYNITVHHDHSPLFDLADRLVLISFIADIFIRFRISILQNGVWINDSKIIAQKYLKGWFFVDLVSAIPLEFFMSPVFFQSLRILKVLRLFNFKNKWEYTINLNPGLLRLGFFFIFMAFGVHWISCGWLELRIIEAGADRFKEYVKALYWCTTTVTTIGYGDITPDRERISEMVYTMIIQVLGAGAYGYIIGNIATLLTNIDIAKVQHRERTDRVNTFMKSKKFPEMLQERVRHFYEYLWDSRKGYDDSAILSELPESFKYEFAMLLNKSILEKVPLFKGADPNLIKEIVLCLKPCIYTPGDAICTFGEIGDNMFFINKGTVQVLSQNEQQVYAALKDGDFFGEIALLLKQPRNATIRATDYCDLYSLDKDLFDKAISNYPDFEKNIKVMAQERLNKPKS